MNLTKSTLGKTAVIAAVGAIAYLLQETTALAPAHHALSRLVSSAASGLTGLAGMPTYRDGSSLYTMGYGVEVVPSCNGLVGTLIVLTGIALARLSSRSKLWLSIGGAVAVFAVNSARISTVLLVGSRSSDLAHSLHEIVFPGLWFILFGLLWYSWLHHEYGSRILAHSESVS